MESIMKRLERVNIDAPDGTPAVVQQPQIYIERDNVVATPPKRIRLPVHGLQNWSLAQIFSVWYTDTVHETVAGAALT
jgi:hypothetical protein